MSGCTLWLEGLNRTGYGRLRWDGKAQLAHRLAWLACHGSIPKGLCILHRCDNPGCINPDHLRVGSQADNTADMQARNRSTAGRSRPDAWGEGNGNARHSQQTIEAVRLAAGTHAEIARRFGVSKTSVGYVKRGIQWGHL
jgi:hypothetical protein